MDILILDHDVVSARILKSKLKAMGHKVDMETENRDIGALLLSRQYQIVLLDPAPMATAREICTRIRRILTGRYIYILLLSRDPGHCDFMTQGANDVLRKPFAPGEFRDKINNAANFLNYESLLNIERDLHPDEIILNRGAFGQIFMHKVATCHRHGDRFYLLCLRIENMDTLEDEYGNDGYEKSIVEPLSEYFLRFRRTSDLIGRTDNNEFTLILQHIQTDDQALTAAERLYSGITRFGPGFRVKGTPPVYCLYPVVMPMGHCLAKATIYRTDEDNHEVA